MIPDKILNYCLQNLEGTVLVKSWGEKGIFYNPDHVLKRGVYILTVKEKDGDNDKGSGLNRENVYRMNHFCGIVWGSPKTPASRRRCRYGLRLYRIG